MSPPNHPERDDGGETVECSGAFRPRADAQPV